MYRLIVLKIMKKAFLIIILIATVLLSSVAQEQGKPQKEKKLLNALIRFSDAMDEVGEKSDQYVQEEQERYRQEEQDKQKKIQEQQQRQGELAAEKIAGKWESHSWSCCDKYENEYGGWVGPGKLEFAGNSFVLTYNSGYLPDDRYVPERIRKGKCKVTGDIIEFTLDNGKELIYSFSYSENEIIIDKKQHFIKK
jgi:type II secretory pathway pseudopilin PulG